MAGDCLDDLSFPMNGKESIQERIKQLVGDRSLRKVSQLWDIPYSTLNNYFEKNTMPGLSVTAKIAKIENVSIDWLVFGETHTQQPQQPQQDAPCVGGGVQTLIAIWESLDPEEQLQVSRQLGRKGAEVLTQLLDDGNLCLMQLSGEKREAALLLVGMEPERAREILSQMREHSGLADTENHQVNPKRAGAA
ncbi:TPA: XRE family transcriptional regulator [Salmonella enterica subsp. houtenae]|nr:XRE family transcriptional regulator [Salmonella enterica subsp. houtenae]